MKNVLKIYKRDIKEIFKNKVALAMAIALIILPCLYAWFNIKAAWAPYESTGGIQVGVVNEDKGGSFNGEEFNAGEQIIDSMKENDALGWNFISKEEAEEGLENGKYYATLLIPEDFTEKLLSITTDNIEKPKIIYSANQKLNGVAAIITNTGASTIKTQVGNKVVETVDGIIFKIVNNIGTEAENSKEKIRKFVDILYKVDDSMPELVQLLDKVDDGSSKIDEVIEKSNEIIPELESTLNECNNILNKGNEYLSQIQKGVESITPSIEQGLAFSVNILDSANNLLEPINSEETSENIKNVLADSKERLEKVNTSLVSLNSLLKSINNVVNNEKISSVITTFENISIKSTKAIDLIDKGISDIESGKTLSKERLNSIKKAVSDTRDLVNKANEDYPKIILPAINQGISDIGGLLNNGTTLLNGIKDCVPDLKSIISLINDGSNLGVEELPEIKEKLPTIKEKLDDFTSKVRELDDGETFDKILNLITLNGEDESSFLSSPIEVEKDILYPIDNYGSETAPFYSSLALWVGSLLLVALTTVKVKAFEDGSDKEFTEVEKFFGKYLTFITIGLLQAILLILGEIYILKVYSTEAVLFMLISMFISLVFNTITYSLTAGIGKIGEAVSFVLLVAQIAAGGGLYPIQVLPKFFQDLYKWVPFKYSIGAMREAIGGITLELLIKDILYLSIYFVVFLLIGVVIKKLLNGKDYFGEKFEESGL